MSKLENKTKAQLLEIIERKDAIERELRDNIKTLNTKIESLNYRNEKYKQEYDSLKNEHDILETKMNNTNDDYHLLKNYYENICDILATERIDYKNSKFAYKLTIVILVIILIVAMFNILKNII